ncbi:MAG: hypothetical protein KAW17_09815, partial [Candidatus Eisenbacteria sp.]|nr:hypothetical protein [Candidatus Eisenbacteria bacterium]
MRRAISVLAAVLFLASVPALAWAGPNPDVKLAMHVVATYDFLYCDDFAAALTTPGDMDPDVSQAELDAASGYAYVVFCAYDFDSVSGVEFQLSGWPTGRGTPPQPTMIWCPGSSLVLGDPWSGGAITAYGECWDAELDGAVDPFAWFVWGSASADYSAYLPMELSYIPSAYSYPANPHNYTLGCAPDFVEDSVVREYPGVIGGAVTAELEVVSPNGGEVLTGGTTYDIEWHSFGLDEVWIEYTTDGGGSWILVDAAKATSTTGNFVLNTFAWAVPEVNSELCKVRITGPGATPLDMSDDVFEITTSGGEQSIAVTAPNAGENFSVGAQTTITWTSENIENVKIQYGDTTRAVWTTIIETTPSGPTGGSYLWDIPDDTGQWFMKVCDAGDETPCDISDVRFQISELLDISAPEGGEVWQVGTEQTIAWTHAGIAFVNIEYGLMNWYPIASNVPAGDGSYEWTIPNDPGVWQVRVSDAEDGEPNPVSGAFQIFAPEVTVTAPNGGEVFAVGSEQSITWDSVGEFPSVGIEYATDGVERQTWQPVIPTTPNDGEFLWTVPDDVSTTCLVRICAIGTGVPEGTCDESDGVFTISQSIEVTLPVGGEVWEVGSVEQIAWTSGGIANVSIAYGFEEGKGWTTIETSYDASLTPYDWTIPDDPGTYYIRVCDANDGSPCDDSDGMIEIVEMIEVTVPAGGEDWQVDSTQDVEWQSAGLSEVNIYYGYFWKGDFVKGGGGGTIVEGYDAEAGSYSWGIPNDPGYWQVLIEDAEDATPYDMSDGFYITLPTVTLTRPNGEEIFVVGTQESITWESTGVFDYVSLEYMTDVDKGGWIEITPQTDNDGDYDWTVPDDPSEWCLVRVCVVNPPGGDPICDESDGTFEIQMQEAITVIYPNGGESFLVGDPVEITWEATEIETVIIYYGDDLQGWTEIATVWPASGGSYMWTAPDDPGDWFIKICDEADGEPCDLSDDTFNIHETIELTYPVGGERFEVDSQVLITWTSVGIDSIRIYFREIGGSWDIVVFPTGAASGEYLWTVPNVTPGMYEMYAFDHEDGTPGDTSDPFEIFLPGITV